MRLLQKIKQQQERDKDGEGSKVVLRVAEQAEAANSVVHEESQHRQTTKTTSPAHFIHFFSISLPMSLFPRHKVANPDYTFEKLRVDVSKKFAHNVRAVKADFIGGAFLLTNFSNSLLFFFFFFFFFFSLSLCLYFHAIAAPVVHVPYSRDVGLVLEAVGPTRFFEEHPPWSPWDLLKNPMVCFFFKKKTNEGGEKQDGE